VQRTGILIEDCHQVDFKGAAHRNINGCDWIYKKKTMHQNAEKP